MEVQFTYANGHIRDPILAKSTGDQALDDAIVSQMSNLTLPAAQGADTQVPRRFQIALFLAPPDLVALIGALHADLQRHAHYPESAVRTGQQGIVFAEFNYRDGAILDPQIYKSSGSHLLDESVIQELQTMPAPPPPPRIQGRTLHFTVPVGFCFSARPCVEVVYAAQAAAPTRQAVELCAHVRFDYTHGKISQVQLAGSSGNAALDKAALAQITKGEFSITPKISHAGTEHFEIPVCYEAAPQESKNPAPQS